MLLARAIRRAGTTEVASVRRAAANHRYDSPQGPVWIDPENNHCFLTPRLARSVHGCQFEILWEADAPERPDPYLSNLDLSAVGTKLEGRKAARRESALSKAARRKTPPHYLRVVK
jgi:branched-chain amino acid transport system substrate-binding protein